jgi:hypothetical protein
MGFPVDDFHSINKPKQISNSMAAVVAEQCQRHVIERRNTHIPQRGPIYQ